MNKENTINELQDLLENYATTYEIEAQYREHMLSFLKSSDDPIYSSNQAGHFTASAWVLSHDRQHVLLTQHAKIGKWFQLGGHIEPEDSSFIDACLREATEESGITSLSSANTFVLDIDIHDIPEYKGIPQHPHYDVTCYFVAPAQAKAIKNAESTQLQWIPLDQVKSLTDDPAIHRMVEKTLELETYKDHA
ncbi:NUDIX hydrolase [Pseudoalteromonas ardens]|uniref:NUDIX hydrolase n=1 Tax=Pseudoalteromonas ardens TaxID=3048490 RepID=UPI0024C2292D|nr:NUDIX hydrolase [Pseudoalteromonas sp. R96]MDK1312390.1 NUDIX hydrolase [Pseudoalteromonas sp. R96]